MCNRNVNWKVVVVCDRININYNKPGCLNHALRAPKKENIVIIDDRNITQLTNVVYPEFLSVLSFMVYAFHRVKVSSIRCK